MQRKILAGLFAALMICGISQVSAAEDEMSAIAEQVHNGGSTESEVPLLFPWLTVEDHRHVMRAGGRIIAWGSYPEITAEGEDYPVLSRTLRLWSMEQKQTWEDTAEEMGAAAREFSPSTAYYDYTVVDRWGRIDDELVSFALRYESYTGGAHPMHGMWTKNINPMTGADVSIDAIVAGRDILLLALADAFRRQYPNREQDLFAHDIDGALSEVHRGADWQESITWMLDAHNDLVVFYSPYEIGPYSSGSFVLTVQRSVYPEVFREDWAE